MYLFCIQKDPMGALYLLYYPSGRALTSDWSANGFIMFVYERIILKFSLNFLAKRASKKIDNYNKTIYGPDGSECSSGRLSIIPKHTSAGQENPVFCLQNIGTICKYCFSKRIFKKGRYLLQGNVSCFFFVCKPLSSYYDAIQEGNSGMEEEKQLLANSKCHYPDC